jgi:hypothetical protein
VTDPSDGLETPVETEVGGGVGGRAEIPFENPALKVDKHHVFGRQILVGNAAGLYCHAPGFPVYTRHVAEGMENEAAARENPVGFTNLFFQYVVYFV